VKIAGPIGDVKIKDWKDCRKNMEKLRVGRLWAIRRQIIGQDRKAMRGCEPIAEIQVFGI